MRLGRCGAAVLLFLAFFAGVGPAAAQLNLNNLGPPWPQPSPGRPLLEIPISVGVANWKSLFTDLARHAASKGFSAYPYSTDPFVEHSLGMMLCRDDLFVNMYNTNEAPGVFVIGFFATNIYDEAKIGVEDFGAALEATLLQIPGASFGKNRVDPAKANLSKVRPPLRIAEFAVPRESTEEAFALLRRVARRGLFYNTTSYMDRRVPLMRIDMWRTDLKVAVANQLAPEKFRVTIFSYLPLPNVPQAELDRIADAFISELAEGLTQISGSQFTMVKQ